MDNQPELSDISEVTPYDVAGVPSRANMMTRLIVVMVVVPVLTIALFIFLTPTNLSGTTLIWTAIILFVWMILFFLMTNITADKFAFLYRYVQRGVITEVDPYIVRVKIDGYTGANVRKQQWRYKVSPAVWRTAEVGQVIDINNQLST